MPKSRNLRPGASRPENVYLYKAMISKIIFFEKGNRILASRDPGLGGGECPDPGIWVRRHSGPVKSGSFFFFFQFLCDLFFIFYQVKNVFFILFLFIFHFFIR